MNQQNDPLHSFASLSPEVDARLRGLLKVQTFLVNETIYMQGDAPHAIYLVASGRVKVVRVTHEGYESILCVRGSGDYFCPVPLLDGGDQLGSAIAMSDVTLFRIERDAFVELCQTSSELLAMVQGDCLSEVRRLLNRLEGFAFRGVRERLVITLDNEIKRQGSDDELRLTQQELASLVGASRESISRNLGRLEDDGIIGLGRGRVMIKDRERLTALAGGNVP